MKLFKDISEMKKESSIKLSSDKLTDSSENWSEEIIQYLLERYPILSNKAIVVDIQELDEDRGTSKGEAIVEGKIIFPFFVKDFNLFPMDIVVKDGEPFSATLKRIGQFLFDGKNFSHAANRKEEQSILRNTALTGNNGWMNYNAQIMDNYETPFDSKFASEKIIVLRKDDESPFLDFFNYDIKNQKISHERILQFDLKKKIKNDAIFSKVASVRKNSPYISSPVVERFGLVPNQQKHASFQPQKCSGGGNYLYSLRGNNKLTPGILIEKVAGFDMLVRRCHMHITEEGFSFSDKVAAEKVASFPQEARIFSEPKKSDRGYIVLGSGSEKIAFGPIMFNSNLIKNNDKDLFFVSDEDGNNFKIAFQSGISRINKLEESNKIIFPKTAKFAKISKMANLSSSKNNERIPSISIKKANVGYDLLIDDGFEVKRKNFAMREKIAFDLISKGFDISGESFDKIAFGKEDFSSRFDRRSREIKKISSCKISEEDEKIIKEQVLNIKKAFSFDYDSINDGFDLGERRDSFEYLIERIPELKESEKTLAALLIESRMGRSDLPQYNLTEAVKSIGIINDKLEMIRNADKEVE